MENVYINLINNTTLLLALSILYVTIDLIGKEKNFLGK